MSGFVWWTVHINISTFWDCLVCCFGVFRKWCHFILLNGEKLIMGLHKGQERSRCPELVWSAWPAEPLFHHLMPYIHPPNLISFFLSFFLFLYLFVIETKKKDTQNALLSALWQGLHNIQVFTESPENSYRTEAIQLWAMWKNFYSSR